MGVTELSCSAHVWTTRQSSAAVITGAYGELYVDFRYVTLLHVVIHTWKKNLANTPRNAAREWGVGGYCSWTTGLGTFHHLIIRFPLLERTII